jgi:hypothetical protein
MGGTVRIGPDPTGQWQLDATGPRLNVDEALWEMLRFGSPSAERPLRPADAHFPLLLQAAQALGMSINFVTDAETLRMSTS